jgi:hypothetical protein
MQAWADSRSLEQNAAGIPCFNATSVALASASQRQACAACAPGSFKSMNGSAEPAHCVHKARTGTSPLLRRWKPVSSVLLLLTLLMRAVRKLRQFPLLVRRNSPPPPSEKFPPSSASSCIAFVSEREPLQPNPTPAAVLLCPLCINFPCCAAISWI